MKRMELAHFVLTLCGDGWSDMWAKVREAHATAIYICLCPHEPWDTRTWNAPELPVTKHGTMKDLETLNPKPV